MSRFTQAISEGDGISVIPMLEGDVAELAAYAEEAGAEAVAVRSRSDAEAVRAETALPVLLRGAPDGLGEPQGVDACILVFGEWAGPDELERAQARLSEEDLDCVVDVRDEDELRAALERLDPEVILVSERDLDHHESPLEHVLDLLPDVPAGKLVIAEADVVSRHQVLALERAGVDAVLVRSLARGPEFSRAVEELVGGTP